MYLVVLLVIFKFVFCLVIYDYMCVIYENWKFLKFCYVLILLVNSFEENNK